MWLRICYANRISPDLNTWWLTSSRRSIKAAYEVFPPIVKISDESRFDESSSLESSSADSSSEAAISDSLLLVLSLEEIFFSYKWNKKQRDKRKIQLLYLKIIYCSILADMYMTAKWGINLPVTLVFLQFHEWSLLEARSFLKSLPLLMISVIV